MNLKDNLLNSYEELSEYVPQKIDFTYTKERILQEQQKAINWFSSNINKKIKSSGINRTIQKNKSYFVSFEISFGVPITYICSSFLNI